MFQLADSLWPRKGGDVGNRSRFGVKGPRSAHVVRTVPLPPATGRPGNTDAVVLTDGSIQILHRDQLVNVSAEGAVRWAHTFDGPAAPPIALADGRTLLVFAKAVCVFDGQGALSARVDGPRAVPGFYSFQRAHAPNVSPDGRVFLPQSGSFPFLVLEGASLSKFRPVRWDDPEPPAFYLDGSLALCYAGGRGDYFGRVSAANEVMWLTDFVGSTPPTVSTLGYAAVANQDEPADGSVSVSPEGRVVGRYAEPARFAQLGGDWVALSASSVARITSEGTTRWKHPLRIKPDLNTHWILNQPLVDAEGFIYVSDSEQVVCYDPDGGAIFTLPLTQFHPTSLTPVGPGLMGCADEDQFVIFGDG